MSAGDVVRRIRRFNQGRDPHLVARKYAEMRSSALAFYRGTCGLFYEDLPKRSAMDAAPLAWISGDLHPENFGSFRGRDDGVYYDVNDFDEAALAPLTCDVLRCLAGILVGARELGVAEKDARSLSRRYVFAYCASLAVGEAYVMDAADSRGMVRELIDGVRRRPPDELVRDRTEGDGKKRHIIIDGAHAAKLTAGARQRAERVFDKWNQTRKPRSRYSLVDVAERIAGIGAMGLPRFVALAARNRRLCLIDLKMEPPCSSAPSLSVAQPKWTSEADRVVTVQMRVQAKPPEPLAAVRVGRQSFVVKELQPSSDRVRWKPLHVKLHRLEHLASAMGQLTAWSHLRGADHQGAAKPSELAKYGKDRSWPKPALEYASEYASKIANDFAIFREAYDTKGLAPRAS